MGAWSLPQPGVNYCAAQSWCYPERMKLTIAVLFVLAAAVAHAQAARPSPAPGPLIVQQPPSYPPTTHTPPGAGASHGGLPAPATALTPNSPNKRLLPPTKEPGLWAADGAQATLAMPYRIFDVEVPFPPDAYDALAKKQTGMCAEDLMDALLSSGLHDEVMSYPMDARRCMAAQSYRSCAGSVLGHALRDRERGVPTSPETIDHMRSMQRHALLLEARWCKGVTLTPQQEKARDVVLHQLTP